MSDEEIQASDVLNDEVKLALDGYRIIVVPPEAGTPSARIELTVSANTLASQMVILDTTFPTRDESMLTAMVGFLNAGGDPARLVELAAELKQLPQLTPTDYKLLGTYGSVEWVSYYQHTDGRLFESHHGLFAEEITETELDDALEAAEAL